VDEESLQERNENSYMNSGSGVDYQGAAPIVPGKRATAVSAWHCISERGFVSSRGALWTN